MKLKGILKDSNQNKNDSVDENDDKITDDGKDEIRAGKTTFIVHDTRDVVEDCHILMTHNITTIKGIHSVFYSSKKWHFDCFG